MMQSLIGFDKWLFVALNSSLHWAPIDVLMMYVSEVKHFYLIYGLLLGFLWWKGGDKGRAAAVSLVITLILTDQISAHLIKPFVDRLRPCHALPNIINLGGCGPGSSFPSAHATNLFGMAVILTAFFPRGRIWYFSYALLVCYSRIHIGVHYPLDVLGGAALGSAVAWGVVAIGRYIGGHAERFLDSVRNYIKTFRRLDEWIVKRRYALPIISGILLGLAFPPSHMGLLAAIGIVPLLFAIEFKIEERTRFQTFKLLYVAFFVFHGIANYWVGGWTKETDPFLMISCVALMIVHPLFLSVPVYLYVWARKRLGLVTALFLLPFLWTAFEYLHSFGDLGYPWLTLGNTQTYYTEGIQFIEYTGVYGVSFLLVAQNAIIFYMIKRLRLGEGKFFRKEIALPMALLGAILVLPALHSEWVFRNHDITPYHPAKTFRVAVIQPNVDPWGKWNGIDERSQVRELERLSYATLAQKPDMILWPETAIPFYIKMPAHADDLRQLHAFVDSCGVPLLTGVPDIVFYSPGSHSAPADAQQLKDGESVAAFNSSMLVEPHDSVLQMYHKMQLVPFGERTPFVSELPFLANLIKWSVGLSGWSKGTDYNIFHAEHGRDSARVWGMICYESVYPPLVRKFVDSGATALAIITNDGWYGRSPGPVQHQQYAVLRAIENRRAIARCANTGISCFIDKYGNVDQRTPLFTETAIVGDMELNTQKTFYTVHGDLFSIFCCGLSGAAIVFLIEEKIRRRYSQPR